jgi:3-oxosteroid 1-dehydrogenase
MEDVWWGPTIPLPNGSWFALSERNAPGSIIVNTAGQRYMNEALPHGGHPSPYGGTYGQGPPGENLPSWMIIDQQRRDRYLFAGLQGGQRIPRKWLESDAVVTADTLPSWPRRWVSIDPEGLARTI